MAFPNLTPITLGLARDTRGTSPLLAMGLPTIIGLPVPTPTARATTAILGLPGSPNLGLSPQTIDSLLAVSLRDASGSVVVPSALGTFINIGSGRSLGFDNDTLQGRISPAFAAGALLPLDLFLGGAPMSYTGSELRLLIEIANYPILGDLKPRFHKQLIECTTMSVSVHNEVAPARACGYKNPKGFAKGKRTIAGTIVFTKFTADVLLRFLVSGLMTNKSKDTFFMKIDQLPPFNISMVFSNELGYASYQRLLGVRFVTDGSVYSVQDMLSEQTVSYMASDFTPLLPLTLSGLYNPGSILDTILDRATSRERVVLDVWDAFNGITRSF